MIITYVAISMIWRGGEEVVQHTAFCSDPVTAASGKSFAMRSTTRLRKLFEAGHTIVAPGIADGLSARLVAQAGFEAVYASGGAISRSTGIPDLGLLSSTEIVARLESIVDVVGFPSSPMPIPAMATR